MPLLGGPSAPWRKYVKKTLAPSFLTPYLAI